MHALEVLHDDVVRRDVHLRAGRVAGRHAERAVRAGRAGDGQLGRAVHVHVVVLADFLEVRHGPARGHRAGEGERCRHRSAGDIGRVECGGTYVRTAAGTYGVGAVRTVGGCTRGAGTLTVQMLK